MSFIYVIGITDNPVKVGMALSLTKRLADLQIGCPDLLVVHHSVKVATRNMKIVEGMAHQKLRQHHRRGEWFNVSAAVAAAAIDEVAAFVGARERRAPGRSFDEIDRIATMHTLADNVREAVASYRDLLRTDPAAVREIETFVFRRCGQGAAEALRHVVSQTQFGAAGVMRQPKMQERVMAQAAAALNALADHHAFRSEQSLLDEISRNAA